MKTPMPHRVPRETIGPIAEEWDDLADRVGAPPFWRPGWFAAWHDAFGDAPLEVLTARRSGELAGILPLLTSRSVLRAPTNTETPHFGVLAQSHETAEELVDQVLGRRARRIELGYVDPADAVVVAFAECARGAGYRIHQRFQQRSPYVVVAGTWEEYLRGLGSGVRSNLRRRRRRLDEKGDVSLQVVDGTQGLEELLEEGFRVEGTSWKKDAGTAILSEPGKQRFYSRVATWAAARGALRLAFLRLDGRAVAFDLCLEDRGLHYLLKTGYDRSLRELSPGLLLREGMISRCFDEGLTQYEFLGGDDQWKLVWASRFHERARVRAYARGPAGSAYWIAGGPGRDRAAHVKHRLERTLRRALRRR